MIYIIYIYNIYIILYIIIYILYIYIYNIYDFFLISNPNQAVANELTEFSLALDECERGSIPRAMKMELVAICGHFNSKEFCEQNNDILRELTSCSKKSIKHDGTQLILTMELKMMEAASGQIFQLLAIPIFREKTSNGYQLMLSGGIYLVRFQA